MSKRITVEQIENIVIDSGVVYINYGVEGERLLAPVRGGNTFTVEGEIREIEVDGTRGKTKGLRRRIREDANLAVNFMDLSLKNLNMALPGSKLDVAGKKLSSGWKITDEDYLENVTLIGEDMKGEFKKITIYNALADEGLEISMQDEDESVVEVHFSAHHKPDPTETDVLWDVEDITEIAEQVSGINTTSVGDKK